MDVSKLFSLEGRVALVTGGSRGIGKMIAAGFVAQGAKVYISSRKADACEATARELGPRCVPLPADISTVAGCEALARAFGAQEKKLDVLVNNAGAAWGVEFDQFPESGWDKVMNLNVKSPFFLTQKLHGALRAAASAERPAKVINIGSIDGMRLNSWETYSSGFEHRRRERMSGNPARTQSPRLKDWPAAGKDRPTARPRRPR